MTESDALLELMDLTQAASYPVLPEAEAKRILRRHRKASVWAAGVPIAYGTKVVPVLGNGRMYRCARAGVTNDVEPKWPASRWGETSDGADVIWCDAGPAPAQMWDMEAAAYDGWMAKAGKVAGKFDFKDAGQTLTRSQMYDHCVAQAATFQSAFIS